MLCKPNRERALHRDSKVWVPVRLCVTQGEEPEPLVRRKKPGLIVLSSSSILWLCKNMHWQSISESVSHSVGPTLCDPMDYRVHGILQARILEWVAVPFSRGFSQPRDRTQVSYIAGGFFTSWATGKPKNTGVGSLSLRQRIFLTQELNWGLLHHRQILY